MAISYPPIFINDYLQEKVRDQFRTRFLLSGQSATRDVTIPFFPTGPSTIEQLTSQFSSDPYGLFAVYDRMFKMRRRPFPHIKDEQLLYYFYKTYNDPVMLVETVQFVQDLLDRGDESAQDLNTWIQSKLENGVYRKQDGTSVMEFLPVFFHDIKIYQLEETRDIIDFGTARTYAGNKIIIDYCYHTKGYSAGNASYNDTQIV